MEGITRVVLVLCLYVDVFADAVCSESTSQWFSSEQSCSPEFKSIGSSVCNIARRHKITQEEFIENYAFKAPVILTGVSDNSIFQDRCQKDELIRNHGDKVVTLSTANTHSYEKVYMTFTEYMNKVFSPQDFNKSGPDTLYFFGNHNLTEWDELFKHYQTPPYWLPGKESALSFGIAGQGTGVPFHFHGPGFAEVIHGSKRWFLQPFEKKPDFDPNKTTLRWVLEDYGKLDEADKPSECVIKPGEIIYFPDRWWHATLNLEHSVFMSTFLG